MDEKLWQRYLNLQLELAERKESVVAFLALLEAKTSWLTSPASTKYHLNEEHGLLRHSVGVAETLLRLRQTLAPGLAAESCVITGLFHDLGKIGTFERPYYLKNTNEWEVQNQNKAYRINPEITFMGIAPRSLWLVSRHLQLSDAEAQAILYHDGQYLEANKEVAHRETRLTLLLTFADTWQAACEEGRV